MVIIITGLMIVVVDRYRRERRRVADAAARGEYAAVSGKDVENIDTDVELAQAGEGFVTSPEAGQRGSLSLVAAPDGHVDLGMFVATTAPFNGAVSRAAADHDGSWRIATVRADALGSLRPERAFKDASAQPV